MALKLALARANNRVKGDFPNAYWRVMSVESGESGTNKIRVAAFADSEARKQSLDPVQSAAPGMPHVMRGPGENATLAEKQYEASLLPAPEGTYATLQEQVKAACYVFLKTHADFAGAEDC